METLTLEQAYYIGELVGVFVIIVSIVFLAVQVRQNTRTIRLNNVQAVSANWTSAIDLIVGNEQVADIYRRGLHTFDTLSEIEQVRFRTLCGHLFRIFSDAYEQMLEGAMRKETWDASRNTMIDLIHNPGMQTVWSYRKHWYAEDFQNYVDDLIEHHAAEAKPVVNAPKE